MACSKEETSDLEPKELPLKKEEGRFCAFCLIYLSGSEVRKCGKCQRRAYCSTVCQRADWSGRGLVASGRTMGVGQGHKKWCGLEVGEEGLDWVVKEVPGKGRGLVALRDLPYLFRVIVEGWQSPDQPGLEDHPGFKFLSDPPEGVKVPGADDSATAFERKFGWNGTGENKECADKLGFRIALVNHECDSNTAAEVDRDFGVMILYTLRPIAAGEEITMQYYGFNWFTLDDQAPDLIQRARDLFELHGIQCLPNCICRNMERRKKIVEVSALVRSFKKARKKGQLDRAGRMMQKALTLGAEADLPVHITAVFHLNAYRIYQRKRAANRNSWFGHFLKQAEFSRAVFHPESKNHVGDPSLNAGV